MLAPESPEESAVPTFGDAGPRETRVLRVLPAVVSSMSIHNGVRMNGNTRLTARFAHSGTGVVAEVYTIYKHPRRISNLRAVDRPQLQLPGCAALRVGILADPIPRLLPHRPGGVFLQPFVFVGRGIRPPKKCTPPIWNKNDAVSYLLVNILTCMLPNWLRTSGRHAQLSDHAPGITREVRWSREGFPAH